MTSDPFVLSREEMLILQTAGKAAASAGVMGDSCTAEVNALLDGPLNWWRFLGLARRHRLVPAAYKFLCDNHAEDVPPGDVSALLEKEYLLAQAWYLKNLTELTELIGALRSAGLDPLVIKGTPLAVQLYTDPAVRVSSDIDLLFERDEIEHAERVVEARGYSYRGRGISYEEYGEHHYHYVYSHGDHDDRAVELHWNLFDPKKGHPMVTRHVREQAKEIEVDGLVMKTLGDADALWHLGVNLSYRSFRPLANLADLKRLASRIPESHWEEMIDCSRNSGTYNELSTALAVAEVALGPFLTREVRKETRPNLLIRALLLPTYRLRGIAWNWIPFAPTHRLMVQLFMRNGIRGKSSYLYRLVVPTRASLIETRTSKMEPTRPRERLTSRLSRFWLLCKVVGMTALLGFLIRTGMLGTHRLSPEHHVRLRGASELDVAGLPAP
jgi:hypothetical protein